MANPPANNDQREFRCIHCKGKIHVPRSLPPTTGPCPHCQKEITSPGPESKPDPQEVDPIFGKPVAASVPPPLPPKRSPDPQKVAAEKAAAEKAAAEKAAAEKAAAEKAATEKAATEKAAAEKAAAEKAAAGKAMAGKAAAEKAAAEKAATEKAMAEKAAAEKAAGEKAAAEKAAAEKASAEKAMAEKAAAEKAAAEKAAAEKAMAEKAAAEKAMAEKAAVVKAAAESKERAETQAKIEADLAQQEEMKARQKEQALREAALHEANEKKKAEVLARAQAAQTPAEEKVIPGEPNDAAQAEAGELEQEFLEKEKGRNKQKGRKGIPMVPMAVLLVLVVIVGAGVWYVPKLFDKKADMGPPVVVDEKAQEQRRIRYLEEGWEVDARQTLARFLAADNAVEKAAFSIRGSELLKEMERFYDGLPIDDSDTPEEAFSVFPLTMEDRERGIFMLHYDQPPVFELSEFFVPLSPLAVQHKVREPGLLLASVARRSNFTAEALKVNVLFKKGPDGLRIDWETFVQTKYRTMRDFLELPVGGTSQVLRVILGETVPEGRNAPAGHRTYVVADPAYRSEDSARVNVPVDSDIGHALSILNWRGTKDARATYRTATIELRWSDEESPQLQIGKFICWEFLGVGGDAIPAAE